MARRIKGAAATRQFKDMAVQAVKAGPEDGLLDGEFVGYASVFGNVDSYGDIVDPGAFTKTLEEWAASGSPIPALWGHDFHDPFSNIGHVVEAVEDEKGLKVRVQLDLENAKAAQVYRLLKSGRVGQMSFAYDVLGYLDGEDGFHLTELKLYEVSVVPVGANQETEILAVKSLVAGIKEGRVIASKHVESLREARDIIDAVLQAADKDPDEDESGGKSGEDRASGKPDEDLSSKSATLEIITNQLALMGV